MRLVGSSACLAPTLSTMRSREDLQIGHIAAIREMSGWTSVFRKSSRYRDELVPKEVMHELPRKLIHSGFLVGGMSGEVIACSPISEPETGSNPAETTTKAEKVEGGCRINGEFPVEQWFRDARVLTMPDGTSDPKAQTRGISSVWQPSVDASDRAEAPLGSCFTIHHPPKPRRLP
jgi:hypothetical protein